MALNWVRVPLDSMRSCDWPYRNNPLILTGWWQLKYFWNVHPYLPGEIIQFDLRIFFKWVGKNPPISSWLSKSPRSHFTLQAWLWSIVAACSVPNEARKITFSAITCLKSWKSFGLNLQVWVQNVFNFSGCIIFQVLNDEQLNNWLAVEPGQVLFLKDS